MKMMDKSAPEVTVDEIKFKSDLIIRNNKWHHKHIKSFS